MNGNVDRQYSQAMKIIGDGSPVPLSQGKLIEWKRRSSPLLKVPALVPLSQGKLIEWKLLVLVGECLLFECSY